MNKKFIIPALLVVVVLAGLAYVYGGKSLQGKFSATPTAPTAATITKTVSAVKKTTGVGEGIMWNFDEYNEIGQWTLTLGSKQYISSIEVNDGMSPLSLSEMKISIDGTDVGTMTQGETTFDIGQEYRAGSYNVIVSGKVSESYYQNALSGFGDILNLANITLGADSTAVSETALDVTYGTPYYLFVDAPQFTDGTVSSSANLKSDAVIYSFDLDLDGTKHKPENIPFEIDSSKLTFASGTTDYGTLALYMDGTQVSSTKTFDPSVSVYAFRLMKRNLTDGATFELRSSLKGLSSGSITTNFSAGNFVEKRTYTTDGTDDPDYYYCYSSGFTMCFYPFLDSDYYLNKSVTVTHSAPSVTTTGTKVSR